eukprot:1107815_1
MKRDRNEVYGDQDDYLAVKAHIDSTLVESVRRTHDHPFRLYLCDKCAQDIQVLRVNPNTIFKSIPSAPTSTQSTSNIRGLLEREHLLDALEDAKLSFQEDLAAPCVSRYSAARFGQNAIVELSKEDESCAAECAGIDGCMMQAADEAERALHAEPEVNPPDAKPKPKVPKSTPMKEGEASSQVPEQHVLALYANYKKHNTRAHQARIADHSSATFFLLLNICWVLSSIMFIIYLNKQVKGFVVLTICMAFTNCSGLYLAARGYHTCALSNHNTAKCWGLNDYGECSEVSGGYHTCVVSSLNAVKCWGLNDYGELGYGDINDRGDSANEMGNKLPEVDLGTNFTVTQIVLGLFHTCAVSSLNAVKCWGRNTYGRLGYGDTNTNDRGDSANEMGNKLPEVDLGTNFTVTQIVSGGYHTCVVSSLNAVKCWGLNDYGELGYGDTNNRGDNVNEMGNKLPEVDLGTNFTVTQIVLGFYHTCAVSSLNAVKCWGRNINGQAGYGDTNNRGDNVNEMGNKLPEVDLGTNFTVTQIVSGGYHTCAVSSLNTVKCWGRNDYGTLGYGDTNDRGDSVNEMGDNLLLVDIGQGFVTNRPTPAPSMAPTTSPTHSPTLAPSSSPTSPPSLAPSLPPTSSPTHSPSSAPTTCYENGNQTSHDGYDENIHDKIKRLDFTNDIIDLDNMMYIMNEVEFYGKPLMFQNQLEEQVICTGTVACHGSSLSFSNMSVCNVLCDGPYSCARRSIYIDECQNCEIICNGTHSCDDMKVAMDSSSSGILNVYCGLGTSCNNLEINVFGNSITSTACIGLNACDGLTINVDPNDYKNNKLQMFSYSDNVTLSNGFGYEELNDSAQYVECHETSTYIEWNESLNADEQVTPLILDEYEGGRFPCESVTIGCFQANNSQYVSYCNMKFTVKADTFTIKSHDDLAKCYWVEVGDIIDISCEGDCVTSPTEDPTSSPSASPTEPTINPTINPTTDPTIDPTQDPTTDPTTAPSISPSAPPTRSPSFS